MGATESNRDSERGQILIFLALSFVILGLLIGLATDGGRAYLVKARLSAIVDAAALAGARAMPKGTDADDAVRLAKEAACDSAAVNGIDRSQCGDEGQAVLVAVGDVADPDGTTQRGVVVTAVQRMPTTFMRLGTLIGCGPACVSVDISASGAAAPDTLLDVVLVMDTTGSMDDGCDKGEEDGSETDADGSCPIAQARAGALALVGCLLGADCGVASSNATIGLVPFRACYGAKLPCVPDSKIAALTGDRGKLQAAIARLDADNNTNICTGVERGRSVLFGDGSRSMARKAMVILTDGSNHFGGANPGGPCQVSSGSDDSIYDLDVSTNGLATDIKRSQNVEMYVLRYVGAGTDVLPSGDPVGSCDRTLVNNRSVAGRNASDNDLRDKNLTRCLASNNAGADADPFSKAANDHYIFAANAATIRAGLESIARELLKRLRLVN